LKDKGQCDAVIERKDIPEKLGILLSILLKKNSAIISEQNETSELSIQSREAS
jgi:acetyl-CoA carboxylase carboxyl transferase subunit beta